MAKKIKNLPVSAELSKVEEHAGGRDNLAATLYFGAQDAGEHSIAELIENPASHDVPLDRLLKKAHIAVGTLMRIYRAGLEVRSQIDTLEVFHGKSKEIATEVATRALPHGKPCTYCVGTGVEPDGETECQRCRGKGEIPVPSSIKHQEMVYESIALLQRGAKATAIAQNNTGFFLTPEQHSKILIDTDRKMFPSRFGEEPIDAEVVNSEKEPADV